MESKAIYSCGTLSSLQHLAKDFSFSDQFLNDKPSEADNEKTTANTEAESMVSVTVQQDTSVIPPMTSSVICPSDPIIIKRIGELEELIATLVEDNQALEERLGKQGNRINKLETVDLPKMIREQTVEFIDSQEIDRKINESVKEVVISSVKHAMRAPLRARFKDLPTSDMKEIHSTHVGGDYVKGTCLTTECIYKALQDSYQCKCIPFSATSLPSPNQALSGASGKLEPRLTAASSSPPPPSSITHQGSTGLVNLEDEARHLFSSMVVLEQLVPDQFWIEEECKCDILLCMVSKLVVSRQRFLPLTDFSSEGRPDRLQTNPGMNARFWTKKDVDRSKDFMFAIQKRLKTRHIFRNLESFVGGRIREGDYCRLCQEEPNEAIGESKTSQLKTVRSMK
ncbi:hypothetical protein Tco_0280815 [Tanacetum coccineum]